MTSIIEWKRIIRFLAVGVLNTFVGLGTTYLCKWLGGLGDVPANVVGYGVGLVNSFAWNRRWTFGHTGPVLPAVVRFLAVFGVAYLLNLATVLVAIRLLGVNGYLAQALGIGPYTAFFYVGTRYFAFKPAHAHTPEQERAKACP